MAGGYDIIVIPGNSNSVGRGEGTFGAYTGNSTYDSRIYMVGRYNGQDMTIVPASEPLAHWNNSPIQTTHGFGVVFARQYAASGINAGRDILILPAARGGRTLLEFTTPVPAGGDTGLVSDMNARIALALAQPGTHRVVGVFGSMYDADILVANDAGDPWHSLIDTTAEFTAKLLQFIDTFQSMNLPCVSYPLPMYFTNPADTWLAGDTNKNAFIAAAAQAVALRRNCYVQSVTGFATNTPSDSSDPHFSAESQGRLGYALADSYDDNTTVLGRAGGATMKASLREIILGGKRVTRTAIITDTSATTWQMPANFIRFVSIEGLGPGGHGSDAVTNTSGGSSGGSAAYAKRTNFSGFNFTPGSALSIAVPAAGAETPAFLKDSFGATVWQAGHATNASGTTAGAAGTTAASVGDVTRAGRAGRGGGAGPARGGQGGPGAPGPTAAGGTTPGVASTTAGAGSSGANGGAQGLGGGTNVGGDGGDNASATGHGTGGTTAAVATAGTNGAGSGGGASSVGIHGANGSQDTAFDATHGCGSGGAGGGIGGNGGNAGGYGGAGGGGGCTAAAAGTKGLGSQAILVITYLARS